MNEQRRRTRAFQASGEYLMNHIAGVMDMVQGASTLHGETLDEEALVVIEAHVTSLAEELIHQAQEQCDRSTLDKEGTLIVHAETKRSGQ